MKRLAEYIPAVEVSVIVSEVRSLKVSVIGAVIKPGRYTLGSAATVVDALAMAEGFNEFASRSRIVVLRSKGRRIERYGFDYDKFSAGGSQVNFELQAGDIVLVP
jgi:polysaccharide export outer membrane protein